MDGEKHWDLYTLCEITQWSVLPRAGGWEDQDDAFLHDIGIISRRLNYLRRRAKFKDKTKRDVKENLKKMLKRGG